LSDSTQTEPTILACAKSGQARKLCQLRLTDLRFSRQNFASVNTP
jgi:hypothetical protein